MRHPTVQSIAVDTVVNPASVAVPERLSQRRKFVRIATVRGRKALQTANTGDVHIGPSEAHETQSKTLGPDDEYVLENIDLYDWFVDIESAGDGVVVTVIC